MPATRVARSRFTLALLAVGLAVVLGVALEIAFVPSASFADDSNTLTVVGTSDVSDSGLMDNVITKDFDAYEIAHGHSKFQLKYVPKGTGQAITFAEAGTASALLVHAASVENQFVEAGYSNEPFGRAIFYGDYVLLGPPNDPAHVMSTAPHNIVGAFEKIAAAGRAGKAGFVSRGGTPGTTIQEHAIWALTHGVTTCVVSDGDGGGVSPSTASGNCPDDPNPIPYPSWYEATGFTQGPNVISANDCSFSGLPRNECYVFTDRGTYKYLVSQHEVPDLHIVTRNNSAGAPGGSTLLVNSFHAYAINPAAFSDPNVKAGINVAAAETFLRWITAPKEQKRIGEYLDSDNDPPFLPDAAPSLTLSSPLPKAVEVGHELTLHGSLVNKVTDTPALSGETVVLTAVKSKTLAANPDAVRKQVASAVTNRNGKFTMHYTPAANSRYRLSSGAITKIERPDLSPIFGDELSATTTDLGASGVKGAATISRISAKKGLVTIKGTLSPKASRGTHLSLYGNHASRAKAHGLHFLHKTRSVKSGTRHFSVHFHLKRGVVWKLKLNYVDSGVIDHAFTPARSVSVH